MLTLAEGGKNPSSLLLHPACPADISALSFSSGATGLNAAVQSQVVVLSWRYLPVILASSCIMLGWALIVNNLGRRRYPLHWWAPGQTFVRPPPAADEEKVWEEKDREERRRESAEEGELDVEEEPPVEAMRRASLREEQSPEVNFEAGPTALHSLHLEKTHSGGRAA